MLKLFCGLLLLLLCSADLWCQPDRGAITGEVTDASRSTIARVKIEATSIATGMTWRTATNDAGWYVLSTLPPGDFTLGFEALHFKRLSRAVRVDAGPAVRVDAELTVGDTSESIQVSAEPTAGTEAAGTGALVESRRVVDFPLSFAGGRSPEMFAYQLLPGVEGDNWTSRLNGSPAFAKDVLLDGASVTTYIAGHFGESSVSLEAIEEFRVDTSGMAAEFGRAYGGVFNFVLKSGANQPHGSAMAQLRNEWMDANSFIDNAYGRPRARDRRDNYAFSFGGPVTLPRIYRGANRTFFYVAVEKYHERNAGLGSPGVTVPLTEAWGGDLSRYLGTRSIGKDALGTNVLAGEIFDPASTTTVNGQIVRDPFPGNVIPANRISQVARRLGQIMTQDYAPQVKQANGEFAIANNSFFPTANTPSFDQTQLSLKLDHSLTATQKLSGSWIWVDRPRVLLDQGGVWDPAFDDGGPLSRGRSQDVHSTMARLSHQAMPRPDLLNVALVAFNRQVNPSQSTHLGQDGVSLLGIGGLTAQGNFPEMVLNGGNGISFPTLGYTANGVIAANSFEAMDTLSWNRGRHLLKFGADFRANQLNDANLAGPAQFVFNSDVTGLPGLPLSGSPLASLLLGRVSSASVNVDTPTGSRFHYAALFAQDDFKISPRLTVNLGVRWEYSPVQTETYNRLSSFCTTCIDPSTGLPGAMVYAGSGPGRTGRSGFEENHWRNFAPRVGMAWRVAQPLVFRAAYGIFFAPRVANDWNGVPYGQKAGFTKQDVVNDPGNHQGAFNWDNGYPGVVTSASPDPTLADSLYGLVWWDPAGGRLPYVQQWNTGFGLALPRRIALEAEYVGNKATGLYANALANINQIPAAALALGDTLGQWVGSQGDIPAAAAALGARYPYLQPGTWIPVQQTLQPFPQVPYWSPLLAYNSPLGFSTYNALQISARREFTGGLTWLASYTLSKTLDNLDSNFNTYSNYGRPLDYGNLALEKSISPYDQTHSLKFGVRYELPVGKRRRWVGGWTVQLLGQYASGYPLSFYGTGVPNANFATNRAMIVNPAGASLAAGFQNSRFDVASLSTPGSASNLYVNTTLVKDPAPYTLGNAGFATLQIRGFSFANENLALEKSFSLAEKFRVQFRAEFLDAFNRHRLNSIETNAASPLFGQVTGVDSGFYRQTQVGLRLDF